ncbi:hypothetical protein FGO68_gene4587 [Halteria grandinella]|uniref:Uncharacterized protein n=1 Tax=Halteria grandinella TaxID=5974 RepID=A0A8J8SVL4_HALGN|nr:hypothetical protein FGO68_gene4587 [Halteria grandinella]
MQLQYQLITIMRIQGYKIEITKVKRGPLRGGKAEFRIPNYTNKVVLIVQSAIDIEQKVFCYETSRWENDSFSNLASSLIYSSKP